MSVRKRSNGSWLIDFRSAGERIRKTLPGHMDIEAVADVERGLRRKGEPEAITEMAMRIGEAIAQHNLGQAFARAKPLPVPYFEIERMWLSAQARSRQGTDGFYLTIADVEAIARVSEGRCMVTGTPFIYDGMTDFKRRPFAPSLDRVEPKRPYMPSNLRMICCAMNYALNEWGVVVFSVLANGFCRYTKRSSA